jgi:hypothetical protein
MLTTITTAILSVVALIQLALIRRLFRNASADREMICMLLKGKMKEEMSEMAKQMSESLENLFNPKHNNNNNEKAVTKKKRGRPANDKDKHQN